MGSDVYGYILLASVSGAFSGALVMWNRRRLQIAGENKLRQLTVLCLGTAASACALFAFGKAFAEHRHIYAAMLVILITGWAAVLQSIVPLPVPAAMLRVRVEEFSLLRSPCLGIRWFGQILRRTPLRHLGGPVFLEQRNRDPSAVLRGIHAAEGVHLWALLLTLPWFALWGLEGDGTRILCGLAVHLPLNIYPILHLRYVTWRIARHMARSRRAETRRGVQNRCSAPKR